MKRLSTIALILGTLLAPIPLQAQINRPIYVSLPGPGNVQHLAYIVAREKKFYDETGLTNVNIVVLRGNAMNVQAVMKALFWIRANREGSIDSIMKNGRLDQREIGASLYDLMRDAFIPGLSPEGLYKRAELEFAVLKERPNFKPEQFIDDRFYKTALKALANEPGAKS